MAVALWVGVGMGGWTAVSVPLALVLGRLLHRLDRAPEFVPVAMPLPAQRAGARRRCDPVIPVPTGGPVCRRPAGPTHRPRCAASTR